MDYDINYIESAYDAKELNEQFVHEFIRFRKENNSRFTSTIFKCITNENCPN